MANTHLLYPSLHYPLAHISHIFFSLQQIHSPQLEGAADLEDRAKKVPKNQWFAIELGNETTIRK